MTYEEFKSKANKYCLEQLGFNCFTDDDEFEIEGLGAVAHMDGLDPDHFVIQEFYEDFCRRDYDNHLHEESLEHEE